MIEFVVNILVSVAVAVVIGTVLGFAAAPIISIGSVIISKISGTNTHQQWSDYWYEWEIRHRD